MGGVKIDNSAALGDDGCRDLTRIPEATMPFMAGKQAFLEILKQEGVDLLFGNPGTTELPLMDGLVREPRIRYILALQEAVAIAMADGYAQASGRLAAVNVHISPGLGNAMGMLYDAWKAGSPLLLTAGQHDQSFTVTEPVLWSDLPPVARPFVKWATEIRRLEDLPRIVHRAVKVALTHPTGPVFLSLPVDVLNAERDLELGEPTRVDPRIRGAREAVERALAGARCWIVGVMRAEAATRRATPILERLASGVIKAAPLATWTNQQVYDYMRRHDLPYHPLWAQGYTSIGCAFHTQKPVDPNDPRSGRWAGQDKTECGIHDIGKPTPPSA
jgi:thiamine pyrophosphate-dependent acetolactate synthase large subunit-like protein